MTALFYSRSPVLQVGSLKGRKNGKKKGKRKRIAASSPSSFFYTSLSLLAAAAKKEGKGKKKERKKEEEVGKFTGRHGRNALDTILSVRGSAPIEPAGRPVEEAATSAKKGGKGGLRCRGPDNRHQSLVRDFVRPSFRGSSRRYSRVVASGRKEKGGKGGKRRARTNAAPRGVRPTNCIPAYDFESYPIAALTIGRENVKQST